MPSEPAIKRAVAFVDGQNLYRCAKAAFGYHYPNYDVHALANAVSLRQGWQLRRVRPIAQEQQRWIKTACAFPVSPVVPKPRGINGTDWIKIDRATYDACLDTRDYRPKRKTS
jgi:hypothetical protein